MPTNYFAQNLPKQNKNEIIKRLYSSILGRDPDPSALMYYISLPEINENDIRRQMVESEEHKKILDDFKSISKLKEEITLLKSESKQREKATDDKQFEIEELNKILSHKSREITKIRDEMKKMLDETLEKDKTMQYRNIAAAAHHSQIIDKIKTIIQIFRRP